MSMINPSHNLCLGSESAEQRLWRGNINYWRASRADRPHHDHGIQLQPGIPLQLLWRVGVSLAAGMVMFSFKIHKKFSFPLWHQCTKIIHGFLRIISKSIPNITPKRRHSSRCSSSGSEARLCCRCCSLQSTAARLPPWRSRDWCRGPSCGTARLPTSPWSSLARCCR